MTRTGWKGFFGLVIGVLVGAVMVTGLAGCTSQQEQSTATSADGTTAYVIKLTIIVDRSIYEPHLPDHFAHLADLKERGILLLSGPFADRTGGIVMVRADSMEEAEEIAQSDPLVSRGLDSYEIQEWQITDGLPDTITLAAP